MKQVVIKKGKGVVVEVPAPRCQKGEILVKNYFSCISPGTELNSIRNTSTSLLKRALENPAEVKKVTKAISIQGLRKTTQVITGQLSSGNQVGYSSCGTVIKVSEGILGIKEGDHVACAGTGYALHADVISVPSKLVVKIPQDQNMAHASTVALGAIAMQGVRRAKPSLGETFVVLGLGIIGQITVQLLLTNGCSVIGIDLEEKRGQVAMSLGMNSFINAAEENTHEHIKKLTNGFGADGVIITAASSSDQLVSDAFRMSRKKGRVIMVGSVGLNLQRADFYKDEIDFLISTSYGPGRYDSNYEERGFDYPIGYVRWTENRNMQLYLELLRGAKIRLDPLIHSVIKIEKAQMAYELFQDNKIKPLMLLLSYPTDIKDVIMDRPIISESSMNSNDRRKTGTLVNLALVGAGGFAKGMHLPNLKKLSDKYNLCTVIDHSGYNAQNTAKQYGCISSGTNIKEALTDSDLDAILITTRHNTHGKLTLDSLRAGKHVLVEKPLVLNQQELDDIIAFYAEEEGDKPIVLTGFNRRFSKYIKTIKKEVSERTNPMIINYRMNAGYQALDLWYHTEEGGGRNIGEACHIYDIFTFLTDSKVKKIEAYPIMPETGYYSARDNFTALLQFSDGTIASLIYTAMGNSKYPKELMEIYVDGKVITLDDYKSLKIMGRKEKKMRSRLPEKGHLSELVAFADAIVQKQEWPIPLWQQVQAMQIAIDVEKCLDK